MDLIKFSAIRIRLDMLIRIQYQTDKLRYAFQSACGYDDVELATEVMSIAQKNATHKSIMHRFYQYGFENACRYGRLTTVKWFIAELYADIDINHSIIVVACDSGNQELVKLLVSQNPLHLVTSQALTAACSNNLLELAKWLHATGSVIKPFKIYKICAQHREMIQWIMTIKPNAMEEIFNCACADGQFEIVKWMLSIDPELNNCKAFHYACVKNSDPTIAKYLHRTGQWRPAAHTFTDTCLNRNIHTAKWMLSIEPALIYQNRNLIHYVCDRGPLHLVQWLFEMQPEVDFYIDNSFDSSMRLNIMACGFCRACWNGSLDIAQWITSISLPGYNVLVWAMKGTRDVNMAKWLISLCSQLYPDREYKLYSFIDISIAETDYFVWEYQLVPWKHQYNFTTGIYDIRSLSEQNNIRRLPVLWFGTKLVKMPNCLSQTLVCTWC